MSQKELTRLAVIQKIEAKQLTQKSAARILRITTRHLSRLQAAYRQFGPAGLISKRRGKPSNHQLDPAHKAQVLSLIKSTSKSRQAAMELNLPERRRS